MTIFLRLSRGIDWINTLIGKAVTWLVLVVVFVSATNAVFRKAFNLGSNAWLELQWYLFAVTVMFGAAWCSRSTSTCGST